MVEPFDDLLVPPAEAKDGEEYVGRFEGFRVKFPGFCAGEKHAIEFPIGAAVFRCERDLESGCVIFVCC